MNVLAKSSFNLTRWMPAVVSVALFLSVGGAQAAFHLWNVSEVYSSADGSVQFVELSTSSSFQNSLLNQTITCTGPQGTHTFKFPTNLPTSPSTAGRTFVIGTSNLSSVPGGVVPNYVFTNTVPFLFQSGASAITVNINGSFQPAASYTALPNDGDHSLNGTGSSLSSAVNSPQNFNGQVGSIVPVKFNSAKAVGTNFVMSFATASGPNYTVEFKNSLSDAVWTPLATAAGNGSVKSVTNSLSAPPARVFRLRSP